jgi:hypothetical protein
MVAREARPPDVAHRPGAGGHGAEPGGVPPDGVTTLGVYTEKVKEGFQWS